MLYTHIYDSIQAEIPAMLIIPRDYLTSPNYLKEFDTREVNYRACSPEYSAAL